MRRSADKLSMASGTPWKSSCSFTRNRTGASQPGGGTGTKLYGKLSRLAPLPLAALAEGVGQLLAAEEKAKAVARGAAKFYS